MIRNIIFEEVLGSVGKAAEAGLLGSLKKEDALGLSIEKTRNAQFGDYAVNVSPLAKVARLAPVKIAEAIVSQISSPDYEVSVAGGFINFKLKEALLDSSISTILEKNDKFGSINYGNGEKVLLEYVSANPTGPLHIGHGRWAAVGSALANIMTFAGYNVDQEFYINDAGNQIKNLGKSLWIRVLQSLGADADFPKTEEEGSKNYYAGDYLVPVAQQYLSENRAKAEEFRLKDSDVLNPSDEVVKEFSDYAKAEMLKQQKALLGKFNTKFDYWTPETTLHASGKVEAVIEELKNKGELEEKDGALWFKSSEYGDDQDRVIIKTDGSYTYLTADIAYHYEKLKRGYDRLINIWGADHHGYVARMRASIQALGYDGNALEVLLGQLVNLIISGEQVRMGKRRKMLTLEDLIEEVGPDATRYWMIMRSIDTTLDFDVDLAKSCSDENPVYYAQYAHARACSILRTAVSTRLDQDRKTELPSFITQAELDALVQKASGNADVFKPLWSVAEQKEVDAAKALVLRLEAFEDAVHAAVKTRAPYQIARYIQDLASEFHYFYTFSRVLCQDEALRNARLALVCATRQVFSNALGLLGVSAPQSM